MPSVGEAIEAIEAIEAVEVSLAEPEACPKLLPISFSMAVHVSVRDVHMHTCRYRAFEWRRVASAGSGAALVGIIGRDREGRRKFITGPNCKVCFFSSVSLLDEYLDTKQPCRLE